MSTRVSNTSKTQLQLLTHQQRLNLALGSAAFGVATKTTTTLTVAITPKSALQNDSNGVPRDRSSRASWHCTHESTRLQLNGCHIAYMPPSDQISCAVRRVFSSLLRTRLL